MAKKTLLYEDLVKLKEIKFLKESETASLEDDILVIEDLSSGRTRMIAVASLPITLKSEKRILLG